MGVLWVSSGIMSVAWAVRVARQQEGEANFHAFYMLLGAAHFGHLEELECSVLADRSVAMTSGEEEHRERERAWSKS